MGTWKDYIENLKKVWIGRSVMYNNTPHTIVDVDYNGVLHIDIASEHNLTTAAFLPEEARAALI